MTNIKYIITYQKKDGSIRDVKTNQSIDYTTNHLLVWDEEKNGWRTLIKNKILKVLEYKPVFTYQKKDGNIRDIKTDGNITDIGDKYRVWDIQNNGWRTLIKDRIQNTMNYQLIMT